MVYIHTLICKEENCHDGPPDNVKIFAKEIGIIE